MKRNEIVQLLNSKGNEQKILRDSAAVKRSEVFKNNVVLRGVIEITNLCRVSCLYCPMRKENSKSNSIFFMTPVEILKIVENIKNTNINIVFIQAGEVPKTIKILEETIPRIKELFGQKVEILLNIGLFKEGDYKRLKNAGADSFIIKHETSDPMLHFEMRKESFEKRIAPFKVLKNLGFKIGTGMIVGLPNQSVESLADDILFAQELSVDMVSASPFIPAPNTPLQNEQPGSVDLTINALAIMRLLMPNTLIPSVSALEKLQIGGQKEGLLSGANVLTINFTPKIEKDKYLIYGQNRFVVERDYVTTLLKSLNLQPAFSTFLN